MKIKMKETVRPDFPFNLQKPDNVLVAGQTYEATQNKYGAVCGICENGEPLGVKPGEFEVVERGMDWKRCIEALRGSMELFLFDPVTGEVRTPDSLNELDRMTYDAMAYAADFMQSRPRDGAHSWFYTFGTDPEFPFGIEEFVEVHADTPSQANKKFMVRFPCREGSTLINCAWVYPEAEWEKVYNEHYSGKKPAIIID